MRRELFVGTTMIASLAIMLAAWTYVAEQARADADDCPCEFPNPAMPGVIIRQCDANCANPEDRCCACSIVSSQCRCCPPENPRCVDEFVFGIGRVYCYPPQE